MYALHFDEAEQTHALSSSVPEAAANLLLDVVAVVDRERLVEEEALCRLDVKIPLSLSLSLSRGQRICFLQFKQKDCAGVVRPAVINHYRCDHWQRFAD
jgi:hypothetical protein